MIPPPALSPSPHPLSLLSPSLPLYVGVVDSSVVQVVAERGDHQRQHLQVPHVVLEGTGGGAS